jgi:glycerophosphoryl diester phosphodiesterase
MAGFRIFAHRGASGYEPENTLRSFRKALELGARWVELDVQAVEDELAVFHDSRLDRKTDGSGRVSNRSLEYVRSLDAGKGERIPLLREVLHFLDGRAGVNVELKGPGTARPAANMLDESIRKGRWKPDRFIVSSFHRRELAQFKKLLPEVPIGALYARRPFGFAGFARRNGCFSVHLKKNRISRRIVGKAHRLGLKVYVFTVNRQEDFIRMRGLGVDGIFTDYPDRFI